MKLVLPIKSSYVPSWSTWEMLREFVQNAKDEEEANRHEMRIGYRDGTLRIANLGADMDRRVLLLGHTTKVGTGLRGQFGEGLNLALLAGVRAGHKITVTTQSEQWVPFIENSKQYGEACLGIQTSKLRARSGGVIVSIEMAEEEWETLRTRFLFLDPVSEDLRVTTASGAVLLDPAKKGHLYIKGIFVDVHSKIEYGYDLNDVEVDRDRRVINPFSLSWKLGYLHTEAVDAHPDRMAQRVYDLLGKGASDTEHVRHVAAFGGLFSIARTMAAKFRLEHGADAFPVTSIAEAREIDRYGKRGIVVHDDLLNVLRPEFGTFLEVRAMLAKQATRIWQWSELTPEEQSNLEWAEAQIPDSTIFPWDLKPLMNRVRVVEFADKNLKGLCNIDDGVIQIARSVLATRIEALFVIVHEEAHARTQADDGDRRHTEELQLLWSMMYMRGQNDPPNEVVIA